MQGDRGIPRAAVILSVHTEVPGIKTIAIAMEDGSAIPYAAGQFITLAFTHHGREERRSFSISSSPVTQEAVTFTVKRVDNGAYSRLLTDRAKPGDILYTTGAAGFFTLPENVAAYGQVFFFAAGIGITPVFSLITALLHTQRGIHATLIYSNRTKEEVVFYAELLALSDKFPGRLKVEFLYSTSFNLARARLNKALVPQLLREYAIAPKDNTLYYICGPYSYMRMVIYALEEAGIDNTCIRKENFNTTDAVVKQSAPPDTITRTVTAHYNKKTYIFPVQYPDTILQAAKKQNIPFPYSCEVGRCGSCAAICTAGKVWHSYNEVLLDIELQRGSILTCTAHPVGGDVEISL